MRALRGQRKTGGGSSTRVGMVCRLLSGGISHQANLQTPKLPFDTHPLITTKAKHTGQLIVLFLLIFKFGDTEGHAGSLFPNQGSNWAPSQVLTTGLPGNSQVILCI